MCFCVHHCWSVDHRSDWLRLDDRQSNSQGAPPLRLVEPIIGRLLSWQPTCAYKEGSFVIQNIQTLNGYEGTWVERQHVSWYECWSLKTAKSHSFRANKFTPANSRVGNTKWPTRVFDRNEVSRWGEFFPGWVKARFTVENGSNWPEVDWGR